MIVKKLYGDELYTFILRWYGDLEYIEEFFDVNNINDTDFFELQPAGTEFEVRIPTIKLQKTIFTPESENVDESTEDKYIKRINQNIFDFVLTWYGNLKFIDTFLFENNMLDSSQFGFDPVGTKYIVTDQVNRVTNLYRSLNYEVATSSNPPRGSYNDDYNDDYDNYK